MLPWQQSGLHWPSRRLPTPSVNQGLGWLGGRGWPCVWVLAKGCCFGRCKCYRGTWIKEPSKGSLNESKGEMPQGGGRHPEACMEGRRLALREAANPSTLQSSAVGFLSLGFMPPPQTPDPWQPPSTGPGQGLKQLSPQEGSEWLSPRSHSPIQQAEWRTRAHLAIVTEAWGGESNKRVLRTVTLLMVYNCPQSSTKIFY